MEEYSVSVVRQSLVRRVVMGNMPAAWLWINVVATLLLLAFLFLEVSFYMSLIAIPLGIFTHFLLHKAYAIDEMFFSVYFKYLMMAEYLPSASRVNYSKERYKGN